MVASLQWENFKEINMFIFGMSITVGATAACATLTMVPLYISLAFCFCMLLLLAGIRYYDLLDNSCCVMIPIAVFYH